MKIHVRSILVVVVLLGAAGLAVADDGWWADDVDGNWSDSSKWVDGVIAGGTDATAYFTVDMDGHDISVYLDGNRTIGHLDFSDGGGGGNAWHIRRLSGELTLSTGTGVPTITTRTNARLHWPPVGTQGFVKQGLGCLTLNLTVGGYLAGDVVVERGPLHVAGCDPFGDDANIVLNSSAEVVFYDSSSFGGLSGSEGQVYVGTGCRITVGVGNQTTQYGGHVMGPGTLVKAGSGTLTLTNTGSTYDGGTILQAGALSVSDQSNLGDNFGYGGPLTFDGGTLQITGTGFGDTTLGIHWEAGGGGFDIADATHTFTVDETLTGTGGLWKRGPGTLVLSGENTFGGTTTVEDGTLRIEHALALQGTTVEVPAAGLDISGIIGPVTFGGISGSGDLPACDALTVGGNNQWTLYTGAFLDCGGLTKAGGDQTILAGDTSGLSGPLSVLGGYLNVDTAGSPAWTTVNVDGGGNLSIDGGSPSCTSLVVGDSGVGSMTQSINTAQFQVTGDADIGNQAGSAGNLTIAGGPSTFLAGSALRVGGSGTGRVSQGGADSHVEVEGVLSIGDAVGSDGRYLLSAGTLHAQSHCRVGDGGAGTVEHTGGLLEVDGALRIGNEATAVGIYNLSAAGQARFDSWCTLGYDGEGTLNQSGGTLTVSAAQPLFLGERPGSRGTYNLMGGTATVGSSLYVGGGSGSAGGTGELGIYSGVLSVADTLKVWGDGAAGLVGGTLSADTIQDTDGGLFVFASGTLHVGTFQGDLFNDGGTLAPGDSAGITTVQGAYTQDATGALEIEVGGTTPGTEHDQLNVTGTANLAGTLQLSFIDEYAWEAGHDYVILTADSVTGTFDAVTGPGGFEVTYSATQVTVSQFCAPGDLDCDGDVDLYDFDVLAGCLAGPDTPYPTDCDEADFDGDDDVDLTDFAVFQRAFTGPEA